jgi:prophage regulatory protein
MSRRKPTSIGSIQEGPMTTAITATRIVREKERFRITPISRVQAWRLERVGKYPKRVRLGENSVGWLASELDEWISAKAAERKS